MQHSPPHQPSSELAERLNDALPQTQCTRCGYADCRAYAQAMAAGDANINRCPPGGAEGIARLSQLTARPVVELDTSCGAEGPRLLAVIDENWCIGCTLCIKACPVDCIAGASKLMHTVVEAACTGCELCVPVCPVDCIAMVPATAGRTGWAAWSTEQAHAARAQYEFTTWRRVRDQHEHDERLAAKAAAKLADLEAHTRSATPEAIERKRLVVQAALARARSSGPQGA